jgi:nitrite reductase/ring-hydroxylating ferredoxin subunit
MAAWVRNALGCHQRAWTGCHLPTVRGVPVPESTLTRLRPRNVWTVAAWSHELPAGKLLARTSVGGPLVLWRSAGGRIAAPKDRCVHRHAPLSRGGSRAMRRTETARRRVLCPWRRRSAR